MSSRTLRSSVKPPESEPEDDDIESTASGGEGDESESDANTLTAYSTGKGNRVARRALKQPDVSDDNDESEESEPEYEPIKKRRKVIKKKLTKAGGLEAFFRMPLEIISEICTLLNCADLVDLSLSSRPIRALLLAPTSTIVWTTSRRDHGLPDLTSDNMTEIQYAQLVGLDKCQSCDGPAPQADYYVRKRMCQPCRKTSWLKADKLDKTFHPQTRFCVALTPCYSSYCGGWGEPQFACESDARLISAKLFELEAEDLKIDAANAAQSNLKPAHQKKATTSKAVQRGLPAIKRDTGRGSLLADYVQQRKFLVAQMLVDGKAVHEAVVVVAANERAARSNKILESKSVGAERREAFVGAWNTSTYINKAEPLTDEIWNAVKPKVLKILEKNKAARLIADVASLTRDRQSRLRLAHQSLHAAEPEDIEDSFPIFGDFLHLPSVVPFWKPFGATFVQIQWDAVVDDVRLEVAEHRRSSRIYAIKQILLATTDVTEDELDDDDASYGPETYGYQFFSAATSFLFCTISGCRHKPPNNWNNYGRPGYAPYRGTFFGPLPQLLAHQHDLHADSRFDEPCDGHFEIPEFVADVLASFADAISVERSLLMPKDLDAYHVTYKTAAAKRGKSYSSWREMLKDIYHKLKELKHGKTLAPVKVEVQEKAW